MRSSWVLAVAVAVLAGCASPPPPPAPAPQAVYDDDAFAPPSQPIDEGGIFAVTPAMKRYLEAEVLPGAMLTDPRLKLLHALYNKHQLRLDYETTLTRTAAEAFDSRRGNCLSLVIMTAAFAREMGVPVSYQTVLVDDSWSRVGDLTVASGHVNLVLGRVARDPTRLLAVADTLVVDFLPSPEMRRIRTVSIDEATIVAMFMNNRAAEALAAGRGTDAYWWARAATLRDPRYAAAFNTLGVIHVRRGDAARAALAFGHAVEIEPENTKVIANLVPVLRTLGRGAEADALAARLASLQPVAPFEHLNAGIAAMARNEPAAARRLFERELARDQDYHETHFWLARAHAALGDLVRARRHMEKALAASSRASDQALYGAKLDRLNGLSRAQ